MAEEKKPAVSSDEIEKALSILGNLEGQKPASVAPAADDIDAQIEELRKKKEELIQKSAENNLNKGVDTDQLIKSITDELGSRFEAVASISKSLLDNQEELSARNQELVAKNNELVEINSTLMKSIDALQSSIDTISKSVTEIANSPINKIGAFRTATAVERFQQPDNRNEISLSRDKRKVVGMLLKSLDTEEGQRRLGDVVGMIENGFVDESNFGYISKAVRNEIGEGFNVVL